jgi:hypothetical protein
MSPSKFEFLIQLSGEKSKKRTRCSEKPFMCKKVWHRCYVSWQVVIRTLACSTFSTFASKQTAAVCNKYAQHADISSDVKTCTANVHKHFN